METTIRIRTVTIKKLPTTLSVKQRWIFFREMEDCIEDRPRVVIDCSSVRQVDRTVIHLLLRCLEEAMKRNGDVKLAAIPHGAKAILELTGVNRLFEIFETTAEAVNSFHSVPAFIVSQPFVQGHLHRESENAA